ADGTQVYVRDRVAKTTTVVSANGATAGNGLSRFGKISADGSTVAFLSASTNLVAPDVNGAADVFVRDMETGAVEVGNLLTGGLPTLGFPANAAREPFSMSDDGRYIAFETVSAGLSASDSFGTLYFRDRESGQTQPFLFLQGRPTAPRISADGQFVAFEASGKVQLLNRTGGTTVAIGNGTVGDISADGSTVVFSSNEALVAGDNDGTSDVFVYNGGSVKVVSVNDDGSEAAGDSTGGDVSADGMFVPFISNAASLTGSASKTLAFARVRGVSFSFTPTAVVGGAPVTGKIVLDQSVTSATTAFLTKSSGALRAPASVTIPAGSSMVEFACPTQGVDADVNVRVTLGNIASKWVAIAQANLAGFKIAPSQVYGGSPTTVTATVTLDGKAGPSGLRLLIVSDNPAILETTSVIIPYGAKSASFTVQHQLTQQDQLCHLTVSLRGTTLQASLNVLAIKISSFSFNPQTVLRGNSTVGTVTINGPAPAGGLSVTVTSSVGGVGFVLAIPGGQKSASFDYTVGSSVPTGTKTFTATANGSTKTASLIVK
ncbi:MAG TPA: hypothetical protein VK934_03510, partial [Fimbriimonas sp.]|nr:hypothetical protein [Fimbriimonas sp.]